MGNIKATFKFLLFLLSMAIAIPCQIIALKIIKGPGAYVITKIWHSIMCMIFKIRVEVYGTPNTRQQTLFMSNHVSYLDICVLGSILSASFLAKSEVAGWPLFGYLAKLQQCAFIERKTRAIGREKNRIEQFISDGKNLIVFPEGTSTSGMTVWPFKSSLFSLAEGFGNPLDIQPVTICILETDGKKAVTKEEHDIYAWPLEMETPLHVHLWLFAKSRGARLAVTFHPPIKVGVGADRKALAKTCYDSVCKGLDAAKAA